MIQIEYSMHLLFPILIDFYKKSTPAFLASAPGPNANVICALAPYSNRLIKIELLASLKKFSENMESLSSSVKNFLNKSI